MRISWVALFGLLYLMGMVISLTIEGAFFGSAEAGIFANLVNVNPLASVGDFFDTIGAYVSAIWAVISWDFSFFVGKYEVLRYVGWALSFAFILTFILSLRGTGGR